jgi:hypothetical protein
MLKEVAGCTAEALGLEATINMIELDLPHALWGVWRCGCGSSEGEYASRICSRDFDPNVPGVGWSVHAHGEDRVTALGRSYVLAANR